MPQKNYYELLGIAPGATPAEVKAAYRKLALQYHPDKNGEDAAAEQLFKEINEAYTVLSDEDKRAVYHRKFPGRFSRAAKDVAVVNAQVIYERLLVIYKNFEHADPYRMDKDVLSQQLEQLFSAYYSAVLQQENNLSVNNAIVDKTLVLLALLTLDQQKKILEMLRDVPNSRKIKIDAFLKRQRQDHFWEKYKLLFVLIVAVLVCLLMYFLIGQ